MAEQKVIAIHDFVMKEIESAVKNVKLMRKEQNTTGVSWFVGKKRLCKLLFTKKGLSLEVNIEFTKDIEEKFVLELIPESVRKEKHLGTMKYMVKQSNLPQNEVKNFVSIMVDIFKKEIGQSDKETSATPKATKENEVEEKQA